MIRLIQRKLIIPRGDTGSFTIPTIAAATQADVAVFTIFDCLTHTRLFQKVMQPNDNTFTVEFTHNETVNLKPGRYVWDIKFYKNPQYADGKLIDGDEIDSYYAGFDLPFCEIRETGDDFLVSPDAATGKLAPEQLDIISAALAEMREAVEETQSNVEHYPYVGENNHWYLWDVELGEFVDTGVRALGEGVPAGGTTGQALIKASDDDYDAEWGHDASKADKTDTVLETTLSRGREEGSTVGEASFAFGKGVKATAPASHAEGQLTKAQNIAAHVEGQSGTASGLAAHAEGGGTTASASFSHAEGHGTIASSMKQHAQGKYNIADSSNVYADIVGNGTADNARSNAFALTWTGDGKYAGDVYVSSNVDSSGGTKLLRETVIAASEEATATAAHAIGDKFMLNGQLYKATSEIAIGDTIITDGVDANCEITTMTEEIPDVSIFATKVDTVLETTLSRGRADNSVVGVNSFAFGRSVIASGENSHAEGRGTTASGNSTHAEGYQTRAIGDYSHTEGRSAVSVGVVNHVEGFQTIAYGSYSHVEGDGGKSSMTVSGDGNSTIYAVSSVSSEIELSQLSGYIINYAGVYAKILSVDETNNTITLDKTLSESALASVYVSVFRHFATGRESHIEGFNVKSVTDAQHVQGKYNAIDRSGVFADIVGNGSSDKAQSNAYALTWTGDGHYAGDVYVHSNADSTGGVKLATVNDIPSVPVQDVQINSTSIVDANGVANIPEAQVASGECGVVKVGNPVFSGLNIDATGLKIAPASEILIKTGVNAYRAITPAHQHEATFYGLATAAGDSTQKASDNAVGTYTDGAKSAIQSMLGVPGLDASGKVLASQLPSYVDDVLEYANLASFPAEGESGKIYVALDTNLTYRWSGSAYVEISQSLALGETSSTAYRGDYGAAAYAHGVTNKGSAFESGLYKITTNSEGHVTAASAVQKSDLTSLGVADADDVAEIPVEKGAGLDSVATKTTESINANNATGSFSFAEGLSTNATGSAAHAEGRATIAVGSGAHAEGYGGSTLIYLTGDANSVVYSYRMSQDRNTILEVGNKIKDPVNNNKKTIISIDYNLKELTVDESFGSALNNAQFEIIRNNARGNYSHSEGQSCLAIGAASHAEGQNTIAEYYCAHSEGQDTYAIARATHAEGSHTVALGNYSHVQGMYNVIENLDHFSEWVPGNSYNVGDVVKYTRNMSEGFTYVEILTCKVANSDTSIKTSKWDRNGLLEYADIVGNGTAENARSNAYALTWTGDGKYAGDVYVGANADSSGGEKLAKESDIPVESGTGAGSVQTKEFNSSNITYTNVASGNGAIAFGMDNVASGTCSQAIGSRVAATGVAASASGSNTIGTGLTSHAEGLYSIAIGQSAHAEGLGGSAIGLYSHSEGSHYTRNITFSGNENSTQYTITQGTIPNVGNYILTTQGTTKCAKVVSVDGSIVTVDKTFGAAANNMTAVVIEASAIGTASHSEGSRTIAKGSYSHAEGNYTVAAGTSTHAEGKYNVEDSLDSWDEWVANTSYLVGDKIKVTTTENNETVVTGYKCKTANSDSEFTLSHWTKDLSMNYVHIVGNGESAAARSNAYALDWNGNGHYMGDVYVGCNADSSGGTKLIKDVQVAGTSVASNGAANVPVAGVEQYGVVRIPVNYAYGIGIADGYLAIATASSNKIKAGADYNTTPSAARQHEAVFYGLSKVAGVDLANETVTLGTYPSTSQTAIKNMLGVEEGLRVVRLI